MLEHGLNPENIVPDGKIHRFKTDGNGESGWYVCFQESGTIGGAYGDWKTGIRGTYSELTGLDNDQRDVVMERIRIAKETSEKERKEINKKASEKANNIWSYSKPVAEHEYLKIKNVKSHGIRIHNSSLVIPVRGSDRRIKSLQFIDPEGKKKFLSGGAMSGNAFTINGTRDKIYICEGYSTGATIAEVTGNLTVCAFNAGNLKPVAKIVREKFPGTKIIIAGDNDRFGKVNIGIEKAKRASEVINGTYVIPEFKSDNNKPTDFNDLFNIEGPETAQEQLELINPGMYDEVKKYIQSTNGKININQLNNHFGLTERSEKDNILNVINHLCKKNILRKDRHKSFTYKIVNSDTKKVDFDKEVVFSDASLPFDLEEYVCMPRGAVVVIAGESNAGKTAATLDCLYKNYQWNIENLTYFSSEMGPDEYKDRLRYFSTKKEFHENIEFHHRSSDFSDLIVGDKSDGVVFVDYLEALGEKGYAGIENDITDIWESLKDGIAIINLQKTTGSALARGGDGTKSKSRLYLSLSQGYKCSDGGWVNVCKVIKSKIPRDGMINVDGMSCIYRATRTGIQRLSQWQYLNKELEKQFLEEMKNTIPEVDMAHQELRLI